VERRNGAPSLAHRKEMGEKLKEREFKKKRNFFAIRSARNMFGNLDEDGSGGFDAKGEMNELVQSSKRRKH
jgi:hypothetical protein